MATFIRTRTIKGNPYVYQEERWREGRKMRSRSTILNRKRKKRAGGGFPPIPLNPLNMFVGIIALGAHIATKGSRRGYRPYREPTLSAQLKHHEANVRWWQDHIWQAKTYPSSEARERMYRLSHPSPSYRAQKEYADLRELNQQQYASYNATIAAHFERVDAANVKYAREQGWATPAGPPSESSPMAEAPASSDQQEPDTPEPSSDASPPVLALTAAGVELGQWL